MSPERVTIDFMLIPIWSLVINVNMGPDQLISSNKILIEILKNQQNTLQAAHITPKSVLWDIKNKNLPLSQCPPASRSQCTVRWLNREMTWWPLVSREKVVNLSWKFEFCWLVLKSDPFFTIYTVLLFWRGKSKLTILGL